MGFNIKVGGDSVPLVELEKVDNSTSMINMGGGGKSDSAQMAAYIKAFDAIYDNPNMFVSDNINPCIYFSVNGKSTFTQAGEIKDYLGPNSPLRYTKINNFILSGLETPSVDVTSEAGMPIETNVGEFQALFPAIDGLTPKEADLIIFSDQPEMIFKVEKVSIVFLRNHDNFLLDIKLYAVVNPTLMETISKNIEVKDNYTLEDINITNVARLVRDSLGMFKVISEELSTIIDFMVEKFENMYHKYEMLYYNDRMNKYAYKMEGNEGFFVCTDTIPLTNFLNKKITFNNFRQRIAFDREVDVRPVFIKSEVFYNIMDFRQDTIISDRRMFRIHTEREKDSDTVLATVDLNNKLVVLANSCADPAFFKDKGKRNTFINNFNLISTSDILYGMESYLSIPTILTIVKLLSDRAAGGK